MESLSRAGRPAQGRQTGAPALGADARARTDGKSGLNVEIAFGRHQIPRGKQE
jgi:hypothetical protein